MLNMRLAVRIAKFVTKLLFYQNHSLTYLLHILQKKNVSFISAGNEHSLEVLS